ncbi:NAD(P)-dependent oxidoreductase [Ectobacillus antri]|jgi:nucleoside-diphosphate-sugar epimerase|uniref:NAD(P)-dependent oxidoreductase n=1 Tax=Ectobacillus antri TaxID=2486280 RepID=A0ABT6H3Y6_9BACI|nr:NAD(P)-dependent oxidoreductase [Ectobacillus antri]MDG4656664.1 NAD(P)-dependent oxidoreductase [Ectobacillus antri]MDG5753973.1 NAD(P)-dependent oxidoreductase [Ectobacillus antri]
MKGAVVIGALSFIGYHLVQTLLKEGVEVLAFDTEDLLAATRISEEKLLLIGRHAGFSYHSLGEREEVEANHTQTVYFCLCDPNEAQLSQDTIVHLQRVIGICRKYGLQLILISSISPSDTMMQVETEVQSYEFSSVLRVPAVYGPWQPQFMVYQQLIVAAISKREPIVTVSENNTDAVYVEDVVTCLYELGKNNVLGMYYVESGEANTWDRGIELLNGNRNIMTISKRIVKKTGSSYPLRAKRTLQEGLELQKRHVKIYESLYNV